MMHVDAMAPLFLLDHTPTAKPPAAGMTVTVTGAGEHGDRLTVALGFARPRACRDRERDMILIAILIKEQTCMCPFIKKKKRHACACTSMLFCRWSGIR